MSLRVKLLAICMALLAAFAIKGYLALQSLESIGHLATDMYDDTVMSVNYIQISGRSFDAADAQLSRALQFDNRMNLQTALSDFNKMVADLTDNLNVVLDRTADADARTKIKDTLAAVETWRNEAAAKLGGNGEAKSLVADDVLTKQRADVKTKVDQLTEDILAIGYAARTNAEGTIAAKRRGDMIATVIIVVAGLIAVLLLANNIVKPIRTASAAAARIAGGALDEVIATRRRDEIGQLLAALEAMRQSLQRQHEEDLRRADEKAQEATLGAERQDRMEAAIGNFDARSRDLIEKVAAASTALMRTAQEMAEMAHGATGMAGEAQGNADQASRSIGRISDEAKRLAAAIIGITRLVDQSSSIGQKAVEQMDRTAATVSSLDELSSKIGEVVDLIRQVADQTNLLALNATIEAARAGEAGRGFAVVASEVKNLAMQTAKATDEITSKVALLQSATGQTSTAIKGFGETVASISAVSSEISQAVMVQNSSTQEISSNAATTAADAGQLSQKIGTLSAASKKTGDASQQVLAAGSALAQQSKSLQDEISAFINAIRAA